MPYTNSTPPLPFQSGSETSRDAALKALRFVGDQGVTVLDYIRECGRFGVTQKEAAEELHIGRPSICARFNALEKSGEIVKTTERRSGCAVYTRPWAAMEK